MLRTITDYNGCNYAPLLNEKIQEETLKIIEEVLDSHNITADNFSHASNTQRDNANTILTSEKLDKLYNLEETLKYLTINYDEYYISNSANINDANAILQAIPKQLLTLVKNRERLQTPATELLKYLLRNRTFSVVLQTMNPRIDYRIVMIGGASHMISTPATEEVIMGMRQCAG